MTRHVRRGGTLTLLLVALAPSFVLTSFAARLYHERERRLEDEWTRRADSDLSAGRPQAAVDEYRNALTFARQDNDISLRLARALVAAGRLAEAHTRLLGLRNMAPANSVVNLELARLAVRTGDFSQASASYHEAIAGVWDDNPELHRHETRLEFARLLLAHGDSTGAQAQLIALSGELPAGSDLQPEVARLLLRAGAADKALALFRERLARDPQDTASLVGAGDAAFATGDYTAARRYLTAAERQAPLDAADRDLLDTSAAILDLNPFARRLSSSERSARAFIGYRHARTRLAECVGKTGVNLDDPAPTDQLATLAASAVRLERDVNRPAFARDSDLLDSVMNVVFAIEATTAERCGAPTGADRALLLLGREDRSTGR